MKYLSTTKFLPILAFALVSSMNLYSQKFGKIDKKRLQEEIHPIDSSASHAYILRICFTYYDFGGQKPLIKSEYHYRIKIYNDEGIDVANVINYLYRSGGDRETLKSVKAQCYNWVDGKVQTSKLSKKEIFKEEMDETITKISFAIPKARAGSIIEFKYRIESPFIYAFPRHYFQTDVPVDYSQLKVDIPQYFTMAPSAKGTIVLDRKEEEKTSFGKQVVQYTFEAKDVPGIEDDKYVLDIDDYKSSLKFELSAIAFPGEKVRYFTKDWNSLCANLMDSEYFGKAITSKVKPAEDFLKSIADLDEEEKLHAIVEYINSKIVWNKEYGRTGTKKYKTLFESGEGNAGEINLLLINLCKRAGLTVKPVLTKYRFNGLLNVQYPSLTELNYVFALVECNGKQLYVDATSPYFTPGTLPLRALNIHGILVHDDEHAEIIELDNMNNYYGRYAANYTLNVDEEKLEGQGKYVLKDYSAVKTRMKFKEEDNNEDQQDIVKEIDSDEEDDDVEEEEDEDIYEYTEVNGMEDKYGAIKGKFESELYTPFESIGDEIYIDAFVSLEFEENPFLFEQRKYPAFFNSKHHLNHVSIIEIPEGYALQSGPENLVLNMINNKGKFSYLLTVSDKSVVVNALFKINDDIFTPEEYASLHEFFNQIILKQKEKIVFAKKNG